MRGTVVIGEGEKDEAPMLYNGEQVRDGTGPEVDFAVDLVDGNIAKVRGVAVQELTVGQRGFDRGGGIDDVGQVGRAGDFIHIDARAGVEYRVPLGHCDDGQCIGQALGSQRGVRG